jgi:Domain of unknown function (DUF5658)
VGMIYLFIALQLADVVTTLIGLHHAQVGEANAALRLLFSWFGTTGGLLVGKLVFGGVIFVIARRKRFGLLIANVWFCGLLVSNSLVLASLT